MNTVEVMTLLISLNFHRKIKENIKYAHGFWGEGAKALL